MSEHIKLDIPISIIKERLRKVFEKSGEQHSELIIHKILSNLELTEMGLSQLLMAFMGYDEKTDWVIGDECLIHQDRISSWNCDKKETFEKYPLYKDHVKAKIKVIDFRRRRPVTVEFQGIYGGNDKLVSESAHLVDLKSEAGLALVRPGLANLL